jgi:hypothetical protein
MSDGGTFNTPPNSKEKEKIVVTVTSVVTWQKSGLPNSSDINNISDICKISKNCAFAQTKLTSWINYGD